MIQSHPFYKTVCCSAVCHYERDDQCYISTSCPLKWTVDFEVQLCIIFELHFSRIQLRLMEKNKWIFLVLICKKNNFRRSRLISILLKFLRRESYNVKGQVLTIPLCGIKCGCILSIVNFAVLLIHQTCYLQNTIC